MIVISVEHPIVVWLCDYARYLLNRLEAGRGGKTPYKRLKGKGARVLGVEFWEKVMWKMRTTGPLRKIEEQWKFGILIGV